MCSRIARPEGVSMTKAMIFMSAPQYRQVGGNSLNTDAGLAEVGRFTGLKGLYLTRTGISDAGLAHLRSLADLETLILWDTEIGDEGLEHLKHLTRLQEVILWSTRVTKQGADDLQAALPKCDVSTTMFD
jgi:hypothetical protein